MSITVTNNPDGTYTVTCGAESTLVGMPRKAIGVHNDDFPIFSAYEGGFTAHIIDMDKEYPRGIDVSSTAEIVAHLQAAVDAHGDIEQRVLEFSLSGQHSIDIGQLNLAGAPAGGAMHARIFVGGKT